ncbi:hypothetical protein PIIN_01237 [Serendipita indica DSM 11827]|uniref:Ricin B lectin domain-containing protein n=1 Tax=Serendipita indica (strain DSM 11827) TaxID=1109443 RepID=G4T7X5_SERID|nr:hypothetical protein PIIN_01237 [Serendipita indica DSM 11827]
MLTRTLVLFVAASIVAAQAPTYQGALVIQPIASNAKCLASQNGQTNGSPIVVADCTGGADQLFTFQNGQVTMYGGSMCLDVTDGVNADGTKLQIWQCYQGSANQAWYYNFWDNSLQWTGKGKCMDLTDWSLANGNRIQIWSCGTPTTQNQFWNVTFLASALPNQSQIGQTGTNNCGTGSSASSMCQTLWLNGIDDFCLWGPPNTAVVGDSEREMVAYCTKPTHGARPIPAGTFSGVHWVKTPDYVQITGAGDFTKIHIPAGDDGGELDNHGADGNGNPIGGLVYGNSFGPSQQYHEWSEFISYNEFCIRACVGPSAPSLCNHIYDVMGCRWNFPANYDPGVFESCQGDDSLPAGIYGTSTWYQGVSPTPSAHPIPASSNCVTTATV